MAQAGGLNASCMSEASFSSSATFLKLRMSVRSPYKRKRQTGIDDSNISKRQKIGPSQTVFHIPSSNPSNDLANAAPANPAPDYDPFRILTWEEKVQIMSEYSHATTKQALLRVECSFCGVLELNSASHRISCSQLDISLLETAVSRLRDLCSQPRIRAFNPATIVDGSYVLCSPCRREVAHSSFNRVPLRSYANGLWTGPCPEQLRDLTFLEEQCIARVRATRCMFKLELGPGGQFASRGNVCILPQNPGPLATILPPPLSELQGEICVILVGSPLTVVTAAMLEKTPLLVRRDRIVHALLWLKENNPLYHDLDMSAIHRNAQTYPQHGVPFPVADFLRTEASSEGSNYTEQANTENFSSVNALGMPSSTVVDVDSVDSTYQQRKLATLRLLKNNSPFVKFPSGSKPVATRNNPKIYGQLWPTLFPYGVGMMEYHELSLDQESVSFRKVDTKVHVTRLLRSGSDRRFRTHLSFIFVMGNLMQRRQAAFNAKLAVKRAWFPQVNELYQQIDEATITSYQERLKSNLFAKPVTSGEKAASKLMQYVSYVAQDVPGSTGEIQKMRQEIYSIINQEGLPHVFLTLNPTDTNNPIAQFLAGRDIDLDAFFHDLEAGKENFVRASTISHDPIAGAEFFNVSVRNLIDVLLGVTREDGVGVFGKVTTYYGVVESQGRGRLHIHMLIWLKNGYGPIELLEGCRRDPDFAAKVFRWHEDVFSQSIPEGTHPFDRSSVSYSRQPVMSRPRDPANPEFESGFNQDLRDVLENTAQIHEHSDTCFKYLPKSLKNMKDNDKDCRFQLPRDTVDRTHINEDGQIVLRCNNGRVNPYSPIIVSTERCNMDSKPIGSGTVALAMVEYTCNYTVKGATDTAFVFTALSGSLQALSKSPPTNVDGILDTAERSRLLMVKTVNQLIGKRELSSQQMATRLLCLPSKYTNRRFPVFYWSKMLREVAPAIFTTDTEQEQDPSNDVTKPSDAEDADIALDHT